MAQVSLPNDRGLRTIYALELFGQYVSSWLCEARIAKHLAVDWNLADWHLPHAFLYDAQKVSIDRICPAGRLAIGDRALVGFCCRGLLLLL